MLIQAAGLAVLAAISPTALIVSAVFLGAENPRRTALLYLAGALLITGSMAVAVFVVLQAGEISRPHHHDIHYGVQLGLGLLLLATALLLGRRARRARERAKAGKGLISRMIARPNPKIAFVVGVLVYLPSITFVAAIEAVAAARDTLAASALALLVVVVITLICVWVPFVFFMVAPERTTHLLHRFNGWLRANGRTIVICVVTFAGSLLVINGALGLTGVVA